MGQEIQEAQNFWTSNQRCEIQPAVIYSMKAIPICYHHHSRRLDFFPSSKNCLRPFILRFCPVFGDKIRAYTKVPPYIPASNGTVFFSTTVKFLPNKLTWTAKCLLLHISSHLSEHVSSLPPFWPLFAFQLCGTRCHCPMQSHLWLR